jgi:hypothetical protein
MEQVMFFVGGVGFSTTRRLVLALHIETGLIGVGRMQRVLSAILLIVSLMALGLSRQLLQHR